MARMSLRIVLVDDHRMMREGLRALIAGLEGTEVIAEAGDGRSAVKLARELRPDLMIMDIGMSELNGVDATRQIRAEAPQVKVIALSMHADVRFVSEMLKAGACGYLLKDSAFEELAHAIRVVTAGGTYLSPELAGEAVGSG